MKRSLSVPVAAIAAVVLGIAGFGAGFAARVSGDDNSPDAILNNPAPNANHSSSGPATFPGRDIRSGESGAPAGVGKSAYGPNDLAFHPGCQVDMPAAIGPGGVDLSKANFAVRPLGSAFVPMSFSVRAEAECSIKADTPSTGALVVDTTWRHKDSGVQLTVSQRLAGKDLVNVIRQNQATFTSGGYSYQLFANVYYYAGAKNYGIVPVDASGGRGPAPSPSFAPGGADPATEAIILAAAKDLAPDFSDQCFAREVQGDWSDLAQFGLGDPRPAIPNGNALQGMIFTFIKPATTNCGGGTLTSDRGLQFSANWYGGDKTASSVSIYAGGMGSNFGGPVQGFGQIGDMTANWQSRNIQFNIYGNKNNSGLGIDAIRKIAKALDPSFNEACFVTETSFKGGDLGKFGLNTPKLPNGYKTGEEHGTSFKIADGCEVPDGYAAGGLSYYAQFADGDGNAISIAIERSQFSKFGPGNGYIAPGNIYWSDGNGVMYSVNGYSQDGGSGPSLDVLKAVAKSLDPNVDFAKLQEGGGIGGGIKPLPAPAIGSGSSGPATR